MKEESNPFKDMRMRDDVKETISSVKKLLTRMDRDGLFKKDDVVPFLFWRSVFHHRDSRHIKVVYTLLTIFAVLQVIFDFIIALR